VTGLARFIVAGRLQRSHISQKYANTLAFWNATTIAPPSELFYIGLLFTF
jgi:hypothetical protein